MGAPGGNLVTHQVQISTALVALNQHPGPGRATSWWTLRSPSAGLSTFGRVALPGESWAVAPLFQRLLQTWGGLPPRSEDER